MKTNDLIAKARIQLVRTVAQLVLAKKARTAEEKNKHIDAALELLGSTKMKEETK